VASTNGGGGATGVVEPAPRPRGARGRRIETLLKSRLSTQTACAGGSALCSSAAVCAASGDQPSADKPAHAARVKMMAERVVRAFMRAVYPTLILAEQCQRQP
jgi:hypothetical protein